MKVKVVDRGEGLSLVCRSWQTSLLAHSLSLAISRCHSLDAMATVKPEDGNPVNADEGDVGEFCLLATTPCHYLSFLPLQHSTGVGFVLVGQRSCADSNTVC